MGVCVSTAATRPVRSVLSVDTIKPMSTRTVAAGKAVGMFYPMDMHAKPQIRSPEETKRVDAVKEAFDL